MPARSAAQPDKARSTPRRPTAAKVGSEADRQNVRIFVSYSHADEAARAKLERHLAPLKREGVSTWFDGDIHAGGELDPAIARELRRAHLFVALISSDYLSSDYCWRKEYLRAMGRCARGTMHVVGVVLRPCDWKGSGAARFKLLPKDGRAVSNWRSADDAFLDVTAGIRTVVKAIRRELAEMPPKTAKRSVRKRPAQAVRPQSADRGKRVIAKNVKVSRPGSSTKPRSTDKGAKPRVTPKPRKPGVGPKGKA